MKFRIIKKTIRHNGYSYTTYYPQIKRWFIWRPFNESGNVYYSLLDALFDNKILEFQYKRDCTNFIDNMKEKYKQQMTIEVIDYE